MENSSSAIALLWEEQRRADRARKVLEHREWLKSFGLISGLIVLALTVATVLARLSVDGTIRL